MAKFPGTFEFTPLPAKRREIAYAVVAVLPNGSRQAVGVVRQKYFPHIAMQGWEATGPDGHRGVHHEQWQAAAGLVWDGKSYHAFIHPTR